MAEHTEDKINISDEQLELLAASFFPVIRNFYKSDRGKKFWVEHLKKSERKLIPLLCERRYPLKTIFDLSL